MLNSTILEQYDPVGQGHRFELIVRDVDRRRAEPLVQSSDFHPHVIAQFGVQVGQRLVEKEHGRGLDHRAGDGDPLLLAAGELGRATSSRFLWLLEEIGEPYDIQYVSIRRSDGSGALDPANPHPHGKVPVLKEDYVACCVSRPPRALAAGKDQKPV